ncbi:MAG: right-handed parallel beta-helix repeat-containing protein [Planctomycetota bacterium]
MFSSFDRRQRWSYAPTAALLIALVAMAGPVLANVTIGGVERDQVVTGELTLTATSSSPRTRSISIHLIGPDGTEMTNRADGRSVSLFKTTGSDDGSNAWDTTVYPEGQYTVAAYATEQSRTERKIRTASVTFTINHPDTVSQPALITSQPGAAQETAAEENDAADVAADEGAQPIFATNTSSRAPVNVVDTRDPSSVRFTSGALTQRQIGDGRGVSIEAQADNGQTNADVLVIVWDDDRREMVRGFKRELPAQGTHTLAGSVLDQLPVGNMELQAHFRVDGRIRQTVKHKFVNRAAPNVTAADLPNIKFVAGVVDTVTRGEAAAMAFEMDGELPANADVLVLAWSIDQSRLVPGFAHVITDGPFEISAARLNTLPEGRVELQLRPRLNGKIEDKIVNTVTVQTPVSAGLPDGEGAEETPGDSGGDESPDADGGTTGDGDETETPTTGGTPVGSSGGGVVETPVDVQFNLGSVPSQYVIGSGTAVAVDVTGTLPAGADILMLMWHNDRAELIGGFAHELSAAPFAVDSAKLDAVPAGNAELQALLRIPGQPLAIKKRSIRIVDPNAPETPEEPAPADPGNGGDVDYSDLNLSSTGFTVFTKSADTRVIYVAANGNDNNDGLSPSSPLKTPSAGYKKLRNGYPDWLLFKAGDTFRGNLGSLGKSGRSAKERMLIGVYGDGPRPIFHSPSNSWARKEFKGRADHVAFVGLHLIAINRKEAAERGNASGMGPDQWKQSGISFLGDAEDVLIEDCILEYFKFALVFQSGKDWGFMKDVKVRRSAMINSYGHWDKNIGGHSSGAYIEYVDGLLLEENVWSRNGYNDRISGAQPTKFNHNIYVQSDNRNCVVRGNVISNGSAHGLQLRPGGIVDDNLFVSNPMAMYVARHESWIRRNVILQSDDLGDNKGDERGFGMQTLPCVHAHFENNIISQKRGTAEWGDAIGMIWSKGATEWLDGRPFKVTLKDNHIYDWPRYDGRESAINHETPSAQIVVNTRNYLDTASGGKTNPPWVDPDRDVESYMSSIGKTPTLDAFIKGAVYRPRGQWVKEFTADEVNRYVRRGFDFKQGD